MAIGYTEIDFLNGSAPALNATNLNKMDEAIKDACDLLDAETVAGRALVEAADADAQRTALGLGDSATLDVGTGAGDVAAGNAPAGAVTTHESTYAHANIPTADEKARLSDIQAASGATTALKLANLTSPATPTQQGVALLGASGGAPKLTKMPDGATAVYAQDAWATADSWGGVIPSVSGGIATFAFTGTGTQNASRAIPGSHGKVIGIRYKTNNSRQIGLFTSAGYQDIGFLQTTGETTPEYVTRFFKIPIWNGTGVENVTRIYLYSGEETETVSVDWIWIGDYSYLPGSLSEEAARVWSEAADAPGVPVAASGTLTFGSAAQPGDTVTLGGKVYTFRDATYWAGGPVEGDIRIGATAAACADNLHYGITRKYAGSYDGVLYKCAATNPLVYATVLNNVCNITAGTSSGTNNIATTQATGELGNQITIASSSGGRIVPSGPTLTGGCSAGAAKIKTLNNAALGYVPAATPNKTATTSIGYFAVADCASGAQVTLPAGGTWAWEVTTYGATYNSVKSGTAAGGAAITGTASANLCMRYERVA